MSECEHNWRLYEEESVSCTICDEILDHPEELAQELMNIFEDLGTMHGLKEQYRIKLEKAEARVKELEAAHKKLLDGITEDCAKMRSILGSE
jgi:hypothetical protein